MEDKLFNDQSQALVAQRDEAAVARAVQEVQAALVIGQRFPRDEVKVKAKILEACKRKELAEVAEYEYSRGGTRITGPTIDLLTAIANRWGNLRYGWTEVERRDGASYVRCFAWDLQTNGQAERTVAVKHWRDTQGGGYALTDERDIYEMLANHASRRVRACLEQVIDSDIIAAAIDQCRLTLRTGEKVPLKDRAVQMVSAFAEFGVTQPMIEARLGNKLDAVSENQMASLRRVFKSIKDGVGKREDYFKPEAARPDFTGETGYPTEAPAGTVAPAASDADGDLGPQKKPEPAAAPQPETPSMVKSVRLLCQASKIKEGWLLDFASSLGLTDGSAAGIEDLQLTAPDALKRIHDNWPDISKRILEARKGK
jgi:hypothetical protein